MSLSTGRIQLHSAMKTAKEHWEEVRLAWHDKVSAEFEESCLVPLEQQVQSTLRAIDRLSAILVQMHEECGDQPR
jgi:hypothetical protein